MNRSDLLGGATTLPTANGAAPVITEKAAPAPQPPALAVCIPSFSTIMADTTMALAALCSYTVNTRAARLAICNQKASMVTMARNDLAKRAIDMAADFVLFIDSDLIFPADAAVRLMNHNVDIVGATYNKRVPPFETLGKLKGRWEDYKTGGLCEAEYLPGGFMMVKTEVFKKLEWPWYFETFNRPGSPMDCLVGLLRDSFMLQPHVAAVDSVRENAEIQKWLAETWPLEPGNKIMSEDYNFCRKARHAGFKIHCDLTLTWQLKHIGEQQVACTPPSDMPAEVHPSASTEGPITAPMTAIQPQRPPSIVTV